MMDFKTAGCRKVNDKHTESQPKSSLGSNTERLSVSHISAGEDNKKHIEGGRERKRGSSVFFSKSKVDKRELTPELARISALTEGPPKPRCECKQSWIGRSSTCPHFNRFSASSSSQTHPPQLEREDMSTSSCRRPTNAPNFQTDDVSELRAALKAYCDQRRPKRDIDLEPPVLEPLDPVAYYYDSDGNKIWICPTCGGQDDGSPMIGCDECDAWYHWVCVGMNAAPDEKDDWYCRHCIAKRQERMRGRSKVLKSKNILIKKEINGKQA